MRLRQPDKQLKAQSKGRQLVGVPRQGCLPHPAARDPASMAKVVQQVWLCFLSFIYGPIPDRQVPSSKFNQGDAVHKVILPMEINQKTTKLASAFGKGVRNSR